MQLLHGRPRINQALSQTFSACIFMTSHSPKLQSVTIKSITAQGGHLRRFRPRDRMQKAKAEYTTSFFNQFPLDRVEHQLGNLCFSELFNYQKSKRAVGKNFLLEIHIQIVEYCFYHASNQHINTNCRLGNFVIISFLCHSYFICSTVTHDVFRIIEKEPLQSAYLDVK